MSTSHRTFRPAAPGRQLRGPPGEPERVDQALLRRHGAEPAFERRERRDGLAPKKDVQHDRPDDRSKDHQPDRNEDGHVVRSPGERRREPIESQLRERERADAEDREDQSRTQQDSRGGFHAARRTRPGPRGIAVRAARAGYRRSPGHTRKSWTRAGAESTGSERVDEAHREDRDRQQDADDGPDDDE